MVTVLGELGRTLVCLLIKLRAVADSSEVARYDVADLEQTSLRSTKNV